MRIINTIFFILITFFCFSQKPEGGNNYKRQVGNKMQRQTGNCIVKGKVIDKESLSNVEYASIAIYRVKDSSLVNGGITNENGDFEIENLPNGKFYIVINSIGYKKKKISNILLTQDKNNFDLDKIIVERSETQLDEVSVIANHSTIEFKPDKKVLNVGSDIANAGGTAVQALENMPSVQVDMEGSVSLRGSSNFTVLVDGKPSSLSGTEALEQIPVAMIDKIEVITNPSAKYDPQGDVGIINIVSKRNKSLNFSINNEFETDFRHKIGIGTSASKKINNTNLSLSYNYRNQVNNGDFWQKNTSLINDKSVYETQGNREFNRGGQNLNLGITQYFNERNILDFSLKFGTKKRPRKRYETRHTTTATKDTSYKNSTINDNNSLFGSSDLSYKYIFADNKDHVIDFSLFYSYSTNDKKDIIEDFDLSDNITRQENGENNFNKYEVRGTADYVHPFKNGTFNSGYNFTQEANANDYVYKRYNLFKNEWIKDNAISNAYDYFNAVHAMYIDFSYNILDFKLQAGLRGEYTDRSIKLTSPTIESHSLDRIDFFPSFFVSRDLFKDYQLQISYSRRINRPRDHELNPFKDVSNPMQTRTGNPDLKPEFIDSYQLSLNRLFEKGNVSFDGFYRKTTNKIERLQQQEVGNVINMTMANASKAEDMGGEIFIHYDIFDWWTINTNGALSHYKIASSADTANAKENTNYSFSVKNEFEIAQKYSIFRGFKFQIAFRYNSSTVSSQSTNKASFKINASIQQTLLKDKSLIISLSMRDLLKAQMFDSKTTTATFISEVRFEPEWPIIEMSIKYRFNQIRDRGKRKPNGENGEGNGGEGFDVMF